MPYTNDSKPSSSFSNDAEAASVGASIAIGQPIGLLLTLTYAIASGFNFATKPSSSYSNDSEPS